MKIERSLACLLFCLSLTMILTAAENKQESEPLQDRTSDDRCQSSFYTQALEDAEFLPLFARVQQSSSAVKWTPWPLNCDMYTISLSPQEALCATCHQKDAPEKQQWWTFTHVHSPEKLNSYRCPTAARLGSYLKERWEKENKK